MSLGELERQFFLSVPEGEEYDFAFISEVALAIHQFGASGDQFLSSQLDSDETRVRSVLLALTACPVAAGDMGALLQRFLGDPRPLVVAAAIHGLRQIRDIGQRTTVLDLLASKSPSIRVAVLMYLGQVDQLESVPVLLRSLKDEHPVVRATATDLLGELGVVEGMPQLLSLLSDADSGVRQAAASSIRSLVRKQSGPPDHGSET
jgi:hypothetical protein